MPSINLISVQRAQKRAAERKMRALFFAWVAEGVVVVLGAGFLLWRTESLKAQLDEVNARGQKLAPLQQQIQETQKEISKIQPKLTTLQEARTSTERWQRILAHISVNTPGHTWVTSIRSELPKEEKGNTGFTLTGFAADQNLVGEMMLRLNTCNDLQKIDLKFTQTKQLLNSSGVEFEIASSIKNNNADAENTAKGGEANAPS